MFSSSTARRGVLAGTLILLLAGASFRESESVAATVPTVAYRVNAGGPALTGSPVWSADTAAAPSPYANAAATGNTVYATGAAIDLSHPSIPAGTPAALFQDERW